jgi:hypothetical protein
LCPGPKAAHPATAASRRRAMFGSGALRPNDGARSARRSGRAAGRGEGDRPFTWRCGPCPSRIGPRSTRQVLDDRARDFVLFVLGQRSAHPADEAETLEVKGIPRQDAPLPRGRLAYFVGGGPSFAGQVICRGHEVS